MGVLYAFDVFFSGPEIWEEGEEQPQVPQLPQEVSQPVFVSEIADNTAAARCGLLEPGDIVVGVSC